MMDEVGVENFIFRCNKSIQTLEDFLDNKDLEYVFDTTIELDVYNTPLQQPKEEKNIEPIIIENKNVITPKNNILRQEENIAKTIDRIALTSNQEIENSAENEDKYIVPVQIKENFILKYSRASKVTKERLRKAIRKVYYSPQSFTRHAWIEYSSINVNKSKYTQQFLKYDGNKIALPGSRGGDVENFNYIPKTISRKICKEISQNEINDAFTCLPNILPLKRNYRKKNGLLNSWNISFKPGPLSKKPVLKNVSISSEVELVNLPRAGLEVYPKIGVQMDSTANSYLTNIRHADGYIDKQWADFATSVLHEKYLNSKYINSSHEFIIPYENNQCRVLMQNIDPIDNLKTFKPSNLGQIQKVNISEPLSNIDSFIPNDYIDNAVKNVITDLLKCIYINEIQDGYWKYDEDYNPQESDNKEKQLNKNNSKDKKSRSKYSELKRLDVTVVDFDEENTEIQICQKEFCRLGCVCSSLERGYMINQHCGQQQCIFRCNCNLENVHQKTDDVNPEVTNSTIFNMQKQMNRYLSKEEQKFRRTVIKSNHQTIVMGACKRGLRAPKKYDDFVNTPLEDKFMNKNHKNYKVILERLPKNLKLNVWCIVHQLYNCFCKGQLLKGHEFRLSYDDSSCNSTAEPKRSSSLIHQKSVQSNSRPIAENSKNHKANENSLNNLQPPDFCARTTHFPIFINRSKRCLMKYQQRNSLILISEQSDKSLNKRLIQLMEDSDKNAQIKSMLKPNSPKSPCVKNVSNVKNAGDKISDTPKNGDIINMLNFANTNNNKNTSVIDSNLSNVVKEALEEGYQMETTLIEPRKDHIFLYSWKACVQNYVHKKNYMYIRKVAPFKISLYVDRDIVPISDEFIYVKKKLSKELLSLYPPILTQLVKENVNAFDGVILIGKINYWEVGGIINLEKSASIITKVLNEKTSEQSFITEEKQTDNLHNEILAGGTEEVKIVRFDEESPFMKQHPVIPKPIFLNNGRLRMPAEFRDKKVRYLKLNIENDFFSLCVPHRYFTVNYETILSMIETANSTQLSVKLISTKDCSNRNGCFKRFAMYAVPCLMNSVILGPYELYERMGIQTLNKSNINNEKLTNGCWIYYDDLASKEPEKISNPVKTTSISDSINKNSFQIDPKITTFKGTSEKVSSPVSNTSNTPACASATATTNKNVIPTKKILNLTCKVVSLLKQKNANDKKILTTSSTETSKESNSATVLKPIVLPQKSPPPQCSKKETPSTKSLSSENDDQLNKSENVNTKPILKNEEDLDDDVVFLPCHTDIVEISDTEEDEDKPGWFMCLNIPSIGYVPAVVHGNGTVEFQISNLGIMQFKDKIDAMKGINSILKKYVGFESEDLICEWKMTTKFSDLKNMKQFDNHKLNTLYIITKDGFKKKQGAIKRFIIKNDNNISCKLIKTSIIPINNKKPKDESE